MPRGPAAFLPGAPLRARPRSVAAIKLSSSNAVRQPQPLRFASALATASAASTGSSFAAAALSRAAATQDRIGAFVTLDAGAAASVSLSARGSSPLAGQALAVKDNLCTAGMETTASSRILENYIPAYSATAVTRLVAAGAVVFGKTNMDEFGMGSSTESSAFGPTRNPWDLSRVPGGSSGGSAAAVAAGICRFALGSDTGGSIRQPASFCGVTGLKPSYGRVSRHGLLAYASSLDTVGPIARTVEDAAHVLQIIAGHDPCDPTSVTAAVPNYAAALATADPSSLAGLTVGILTDTLGVDGVDPEVTAALRAAIAKLESLGATAVPVATPRFRSATAAYYVLAPSEASANLARYDGIRYGVRHEAATTAAELYAMSRARGFGGEVKRRILVGTYALSSGYYDAYYLRAQRVRSLVAADFKAAFACGVDVLVSPVAPTTAFRLGEKTADPTAMYLDDLMTIPASLAGLPALSVPCGFSDEGLPIGMQIVGPYLDEATVLRVGHAFQMSTEFHTALSPIAQEFVKETQFTAVA
jgi:aspartyl-tRNA(Asn)/glutamyl-tRNA(Gln) amidotransferase subunit A